MTFIDTLPKVCIFVPKYILVRRHCILVKPVKLISINITVDHASLTRTFYLFAKNDFGESVVRFGH